MPEICGAHPDDEHTQYFTLAKVLKTGSVSVDDFGKSSIVEFADELEAGIAMRLPRYTGGMRHLHNLEEWREKNSLDVLKSGSSATVNVDAKRRPKPSVTLTRNVPGECVTSG